MRPTGRLVEHRREARQQHSDRLRLPSDADYNRRVLAILRYLDA